jgi:UDP-N-acetylmuramoyl-L-alanyl-D-glutamate--2,6-diaminopimelate ligase
MPFNDFLSRLRLSHLFRLWKGDTPLGNVEGLTSNTAQIKPGFVFVAIQGETVNGETFIPKAIELGASVIVSTEAGYEHYGDQFPNITFLETENPKQCLAHMAALLYPKAPAHIVAVTGTNGKSSVVDFTRQLWEHLGHKAASIGTLGTQSKHFQSKKHLTTPDPVYLHQNLETLVEKGITHVAIEASSHGLDQYRLDGIKCAAGGFTSFSRDHLDYHGTLENYFDAKGRLFDDLLQNAQGVAVLNADIPEFPKLKEKAGDLPLLTYGRQGSDLHIERITPLQHGQKVELSIFEKSYEVTLSLIGEFQVYNALCALGLVLNDIETDIEKALKGLEILKAPPGRLEFIKDTPKGAAVYVDYAHAATAIETVLHALKKHTKGDLWIIFGAGGGRDPGTRPSMGKAAASQANHVILTDDNPRFENADSIRAQLKEGAPHAIDIPNRRSAITYALEKAQKGDLILVAGKGPEDGQIVGDKTEPFLDKSVILDGIKGLS